jgi:Uma2 family endonuclease
MTIESYSYIPINSINLGLLNETEMSMLTELGPILLDTRSLGGFTDDEFYQFCLDNPDLKFERDAQKNIIIMANTGGKTGNYNAEVLVELALWNRIEKGGMCFDSSTTFRLPNGAVRSPDAAWIKTDRWNTLSDKEKRQFPPLCPDFLIEIKSPSDTLAAQKSKMNEWVSNGCRLAWLINPEEELTYVYADGKIESIPFNESLSGKEVVKGFEIKFSAIFI